jgi:hypothetical protein
MIWFFSSFYYFSGYLGPFWAYFPSMAHYYYLFSSRSKCWIPSHANSVVLLTEIHWIYCVEIVRIWKCLPIMFGINNWIFYSCMLWFGGLFVTVVKDTYFLTLLFLFFEFYKIFEQWRVQEIYKVWAKFQFCIENISFEQKKISILP